MLAWLSRLWRRNPRPIQAQETSPPPEDHPITLPIGDELDLHTFSPREIVAVSESYLEEAHHAKLTRVRLIHGKGKGVQRERIHAMLTRHPLVQSFQLAPPEQGGWGATIVWLRDEGTPPER